MNTRTDRRLVAALVVVFGVMILAFPGCAKKLSAATLIDAMPREVESVFYRDFTRLTGPAWSVIESEKLAPKEEPESIYGAAVMAAWDASPRAQAMGATDFTKLQGIGSNKWDQRDIFVCKESLAGFRDTLASGSALVVGKTRHGNVEVFEGRRTMRSLQHSVPDRVVPIFVAIPDDHTLVISESRGEVEAMTDTLLDRSITSERRVARVRERWGPIGDEITSDPALLVLRAIEPEAIDRWLSRPSEARPWPPTHAVAMTRRGEVSALDLRYVGPAKELPERWVEYVFAGDKPERAESSGGFTLRSPVFPSTPKSDPRDATLLWFIPRLVFGLQVAI